MCVQRYFFRFPLVFTMLCLFSLPLFAATGRVCIAPVSHSGPAQRSVAALVGDKRIKHYTVQVDALPPVAVDTKRMQLASNLSLHGKHVIQIKDDGRIVTSFKFQFSDFHSPDLELFLNPFYETWSLSELRPTRGNCQ